MSEKVANKIFFIGFNKTGTVSYHAIMKEVVGVRASHRAVWTDWSFCGDTSQLDKYDVFTDGECANIQNLDSLYPGSKFILNTRPLADWLASRHKSIYRSRRLNKWFFRKYLPVGWILRYVNSRMLTNDDAAMLRWVRIRDAYHYYAIQYFKKRKKDFLILDLGEDEALVKLQKFLGLEEPLKHQHKNTSGNDIKSGGLFDALGFQHRDDRSARVVSGFLRRENLRPYENEKLYTGRKEKKIPNVDVSSTSKSSGILRFFVCKRANSHSVLGRLFYDQFIRLFRGGLKNINRFVPIYRYGGGAK